jgi:hypothetical protein
MAYAWVRPFVSRWGGTLAWASAFLVVFGFALAVRLEANRHEPPGRSRGRRPDGREGHAGVAVGGGETSA